MAGRPMLRRPASRMPNSRFAPMMNPSGFQAILPTGSPSTVSILKALAMTTRPSTVSRQPMSSGK
ncbi:hypothetical protein D9M68_893690 [compost metagenome]